MVKFSILICSLYSRVDKRKELINRILASIGENYCETIDDKDYLLHKYVAKECELIVCTDNKQMAVGAKRNLLIKNAGGKYIAFVDDDDMVTTDYVSQILKKIELNPDVVVFNAVRYENGIKDKAVIYGNEYTDRTARGFYYRSPNHLMVVRKELAQRVGFKQINFGEDADYAKRLLPYLKYQQRIFDVLYEYWFDSQLTETQK